MFSTRNRSDYGVYMGISPYRVVFYRVSTVFSDLCRSYWFAVDTEGRTWQRGTVRKREYASMGLTRPRFKKGIIGRQIKISGAFTRTDGKEDKAFEYELSGLEWLNPAVGKFQGGKGRELYDQLMEAFDSRGPVSVGALWLMEHDTRRAIKTAAGGGVVEPEAVVEEGPSEETALVQVAVAPVAEEEEAACPQCGASLRPGVQFCGKCGHSLGEEEDEAAEAEPVAEETVGEQCPECGQSLREGVQFCGKCGHRLGQAEEGAPEPEVEETSIEETEHPEPTVEEAVADSCPECGKPVEADWQVCPYCGKKMKAECPECGKAAEPDWVACPHCGASLADG
jgi:predicted amidophosphoribosyltransferase